MFNLKDAFRYQSFLSRLLNEGFRCWSGINIENNFTVTKTHKKSSVIPEMSDEVETAEKTNAVFEVATPDEIIAFVHSLIDEKYRLSQAISLAKKSLDFDIDALVDVNSFKQDFANSLKNLCNFRNDCKVVQGRDFRFNNDGNQMPYVYNIEMTMEDDFERAAAKKLVKTLYTEADEASAKIDTARVNTPVDFAPSYDVNGTFLDALSAFVEAKK